MLILGLICVRVPGISLMTATVPVSTNARKTPEESLRVTCTSVRLDMHSGKFHDDVRKSPSFHPVYVGYEKEFQERRQLRLGTLVPGT